MADAALRELAPRFDALYALGVTMLQLLTGWDPSLHAPAIFPAIAPVRPHPKWPLKVGALATLATIAFAAPYYYESIYLPHQRALEQAKAAAELSGALRMAPLYAAGRNEMAEAHEGSADFIASPVAPGTYLIGARTAGAIADVSASMSQLDQQAVVQRQQAQEQHKPAELKEQQELKRPGDTFRDCAGCPEMAVVPAGSFMMGEKGSQHRVTIASDFAVGKYPVTRDEYAHFVSESGYSASSEWQDPGFAQTGSHPVVNVSWDDAKAYVRWLSEKTHHQYQLLSEAEYEYAERAGTTTKYWWGDDDREVCSHANAAECHHNGTAPIGSYPANAFGLYDMAGNVWEWVEDCYHDTYHGAPSDGSAWTSGACDSHVVRGGSWDFRARNLRSAFRGLWSHTDRYGNLGFRVARTL